MLKVGILASALLTSGLAAPAGSAPAPAPSSCKASTGRVDVEDRYCIASPDGHSRVVVDHGRITVEEPGRTRRAGMMDNGQIAWRPDADGFVVADNGGSGQTNYFSYVDLAPEALHRDKRLRFAAARRYAETFKCGGPKVYVHAWFQGWQDERRARLVVQEGVHSEGCVHPDVEENAIGVVGDVVTGRIERVLTQAQIQREWCSPAERSEPGLCFTPPKAR